jgi:hypothetical protein
MIHKERLDRSLATFQLEPEFPQSVVESSKYRVVYIHHSLTRSPRVRHSGIRPVPFDIALLTASYQRPATATGPPCSVIRQPLECDAGGFQSPARWFELSVHRTVPIRGLLSVVISPLPSALRIVRSRTSPANESMPGGESGPESATAAGAGALVSGAATVNFGPPFAATSARTLCISTPRWTTSLKRSASRA